MKFTYLLCLLTLFVINSKAQQKIENIIIITTDGLRWQEVFGGMDSAIANNKRYNQGDSNYIFSRYWHDDPLQRRKMLMPFLWNTVVQQGRIYGNRWQGNKVNNANPHWFSYPGYSELFTGFADEKINSNDYPPNPHTTVLEFLHKQPAYTGKVAAFTAWEAFNRILNEGRSGIPVIAAYDTVAGKLNERQQLVNDMLRNAYRPWHSSECLDVFTHFAAYEYLKANKPKVLYIGYGETDEWAHAGQYRSYLDAAKQVDKWISDLWNYVQNNEPYKNKTALLITTDHGRGDKNKNEWTNHGSSTEGSNEIWFALIAPNIKAEGEVKRPLQLYQQQLAATISELLGKKYAPTHTVAEAIGELFQK